MLFYDTGSDHLVLFYDTGNHLVLFYDTGSDHLVLFYDTGSGCVTSLPSQGAGILLLTLANWRKGHRDAKKASRQRALASGKNALVIKVDLYAKLGYLREQSCRDDFAEPARFADGLI